MHRYYAHIGNTYRYRTKKDLISDLCEELQRGKKEFLKYKGNPLLFNKKFEIVDNQTPHLECWEFRIVITNEFEIRKCILHTFNNNSCNLIKIKYCENNEIFHNITEFREFLNREVYKEE